METFAPQVPTDKLSVPARADEPVFLRIGSVIRVTGLARSTIYRLMAGNMFPCPVRLGPRAVAWRRSDLDRWSAGRPVVEH
jgi:prophage regulatory protein